ncbi:multidrug resistance-associated protein 1-like [Aplysia californica]|uniref:Multidrug resistance-associated protein 1-like n=1 Tax=Aplysia californica TaxID=6500 RepID=A0ABM1VPC0_APLCA|nr:multidrug resistance-associated protein 1-like [Aplysia californica]
MSLTMFGGDQEQVCLSFQHPGQNSSFCESTTSAEIEESVFIFDDLVLLVPWIPHFFLWAVAPLYLIYFLSPGKTTSPIGKLGKMKMSGTLFMATVSAVQLTRMSNIKVMLDSLSGHYCCHWARLASLMLTTKLTTIERQRGTHYSFPLFVFWALMLVSDSMSFIQDVSSELYLRDPFTFVLSACFVIGALIQFVISSLPDSRVPAPDAHPEELTSLPGKLTLNWITGIVWRGYRNGLKEEDVPRMAAHDRCQTLSPAFEKTWDKEVAVLQSRQGTETEQTDALKDGKCQKEVQPPKVNLLKVLLKRFGTEYLTYQSIKLFFELTMFVEPLLMGCLLTHFQHRDTEPAWKGYAIVMGLFASSLITNTGHSRVWTSVDRLSKNIKSSLKMAVYKKALSARNEGKRDITTGEIVTLVADDCEKLVNASNIVFLILATPVQVSVALYMLYQQLGTGAFVGLAIMLSLIPLNAWVGKKLKKFEKEKSDIKDKRIKIMNEVLNGIKVLKLYAWEKSFLKKVMSSRDQEVSLHKKMCLIHAGIDFMFCTIPFMVRVGGFMTFVCLGGYLDPSTAFVTTSLFAILNKPFSIMAIIIPEFVQASDALAKLNKFLNLEDIPEDIVKKTSVCEESITIKDGVFTWDRSSSKNCIENINVSIPTGQLVAIVGMVGSGKSSLLSAMLGEMEKVEGDVTVTDSTAYVPQEAWILNTSLKENVVFGSGYDTKKYNKVVDACALRDDFKLMSSGDKTLIGEKGINLSGGQKQRVSLARAVYADAGIYLLDDPLSAVDAHVGKHIFDQVIGPRGMLKGKTRVLVTHGVHWSPVFVHLNETLNGTDSVRAYGVEDRFISKMEDKLENLMKFEMSEHWFHAWFRMRMTVLCSAVTLISGLLLLWDTSISPGRAGVVLMYATNFMHCLGWVMHHSCHTETELISLERVVDYSNKPTEASWKTEEENKAELSLSTQWPESGDLVLDNYQTRYREGLDLVLKGVTCHIKSGEKVGIVGRTGAGKSSLTVSVFRLVEAAAGKITLDGQHIAPVGLHDLRSKLSILPQDPVIFGGSLRMNLDPFGEKTSEELWEALKHSHLKTFVEGLPDQLDHECGEGGKNLSMGQRQLVCLARTLLRQSPVLVLDEATAGVDMETDELIQNTIRSEFRSCTVLTIAHRLNTVMDYDRIMVLDQGKIKEFDAPQKLLADQTSAFYSMAKDANLV